MSTSTTHAGLFLTRRWLVSSGARRSVVLLGLAFAIFAMVFVCVSAFTLSAEQRADKEFGASQRQTYANVNVGDLGSRSVKQAESALSAQVPGSHVFVESTQLPPDAFAKTYVQAPLALVRFVQGAGLQDAFPNRYTLEQGAWPRSSFDVVVTRHMFDALPDPSEFTVLSGRAKMRVVGVVRDAYAQDADTMVAGPGTWESIERPKAGREYQPVEGQVRVLWGEESSVTEVGRVLQAALPALPPGQGDRAENTEANYSTRSQVGEFPVVGFASDQLLVSHLPLVLVVLVVSALVVGQTRRDHLANSDRLVAIGLRRSLVLRTQVIAMSIVAVGSIAFGLGVGWLGSIAVRVSLLRHLADQPLSPVPGLDKALVAISSLALVIVVVGTMWPRRSWVSTRWSLVSRYLADVPAGLIRRVSIVLLGIGALTVGGSITSVLASYLAVAAVLLAAPDLLRIVMWALPSSNPRTFVTARLMRADLGRQAAAVVAVGCCLALPICAATQLASKKANDASFTFSRVPAEQIWVQGGDSTENVTSVGRVVSGVPGVGNPVVVRGLMSAGPQQKGSTAAFFSKTPASGNSNLNIMVIESGDQLKQVVGGDLPPNAKNMLNGGGAVDFTGAVGDQQFVVDDFDGRRQLTTPTIPTLKVSVGKQFSTSFGGAILHSTAKQLKLPISDPNKYIFTGTPPPVVEAAVSAAVDAGYDSEFVQYHVPPPPPDLPTSAYVFLAGLVLGGFAVLLLVISGQATRLRAYNARLMAIGLGPRWSLSVLGIQAAVIVGAGLLGGVVAGLVGVEITSARYVVLDVPVVPIALACGATIIAAGLATLLAVRALEATEYPEVT